MGQSSDAIEKDTRISADGKEERDGLSKEHEP